MTKKQYFKKCNELKRETNKLIDDWIKKLINSGALNLSDWDDNYILPKCVMTVIGEEIAFQFKPHTPEGKETVENLRCFV